MPSAFSGVTNSSWCGGACAEHTLAKTHAAHNAPSAAARTCRTFMQIPSPFATFVATTTFDRLLLLVLSMPRLTFRNHFNRLRKAAIARLLRLRLDDPFDVFLLVAVAESFEGGECRFVLPHRSQEIVGHFQLALRGQLPFGLARRLHAFLI